MRIFSFAVTEIAATVLRFVAWDVNQASPQHMIEDLCSAEIDRIIEIIIAG